MSERYQKYVRLFKSAETREESESIANELLSEIIEYFPELTPTEHVEVVFHTQQEWEDIFRDLHIRKGRPIPHHAIGYLFVSLGGEGTTIALNIDRIQKMCAELKIPMTYYVIQGIIHELVHLIESSVADAESRPKLTEETRVVRKAFELTDRFLDTQTSPALIQLLIDSQPKDWFEKGE